MRVVAEKLGDGGQPGEWSADVLDGVVESPVEDGGAVMGGVELLRAGGVEEGV